jgi:hypothetical protein
MINGSAFANIFLPNITVEAGSCHFSISGSFLTDSAHRSVIRYIGHQASVKIPCDVEVLGQGCFSQRESLLSLQFESAPKLIRIEAQAFHNCTSLKAICIPASVEILCEKCFRGCGSLSSLTFESDSKLTQIKAKAFYRCTSLKSICIPSSVEILCPRCFGDCESLSSLTFESDSKLTQIEADAFNGCMALESFCIPASVEAIDVSALMTTGISHIAVEDGSCHFRASGPFLTDLNRSSLIGYFCLHECVEIPRAIQIFGEKCFFWCNAITSLIFESGSQLRRIGAGAFCLCSSVQSICLPASVEILCDNCFSDCKALSSLTFESGSKLSRIEPEVFSGCYSLMSIIIPRSVTALLKNWASHSSLRALAFESGASLQAMIENGNADLGDSFEIEILTCDCELHFDGYSVDVDSSVHLVKTT